MKLWILPCSKCSRYLFFLLVCCCWSPKHISKGSECFWGVCLPGLKANLKIAQLGALEGRKIEKDLVEVTHKNKPLCGLLPYLLGTCFKLGLLHLATLQLPHSHAWPLILTLKCTHSFSKCCFLFFFPINREWCSTDYCFQKKKCRFVGKVIVSAERLQNMFMAST